MPKLQFVDTGLACHLLGLRTPERLLASQFYGGLLENLVFMELCKHSGWASENIVLYHYRDTRKNEVDIVMERDNGNIIGLEVKASASVRSEDFRGLEKLAEAAGKRMEQGLLFYTGDKVLPFKIGTSQFHALPISMLLGNAGD